MPDKTFYFFAIILAMCMVCLQRRKKSSNKLTKSQVITSITAKKKSGKYFDNNYVCKITKALIGLPAEKAHTIAIRFHS